MLGQLSLWRCNDHHQTHALIYHLDSSQYSQKLTESKETHVQCATFIIIATVFFSFKIPRFSCLVSGNPFCQQSKVMPSTIITTRGQVQTRVPLLRFYSVLLHFQTISVWVNFHFFVWLLYQLVTGWCEDDLVCLTCVTSS